MNTQDKAREVIADFVNGQVFYDHRDAVVGADAILSALTSAGLCIVPVEQAERTEELEAGIRALHAADDAHGCGFYMDEAWINAYRHLRELLKAAGAIK